MYKQKYTVKKAFTLVELIVVIVILAILATIAFLSFGSQSSSARDSTRLSDLGSISKGLMVYQSTKSTYPTPDRGVNITNSGVSNIIGIQGEVGSSVKSNIKAGADGFVDPLDKKEYTYVVNAAKNKYQVLAFLENKESVAFDSSLRISSEDKALAFDYLNRFAFVKGDNLGVIVVSSGTLNSQTPVQDVTGNTGILDSGVVDIATLANTSSGVVAVVSNNDGGSVTSFTTEIANNYIVPKGTTIADAGLNCNYLRKNGVDKNGTYYINPTGTGAFQVYCDMTTDGGGWTLVMRGKGGDNIGWATNESLKIENSKAIGNTFKFSDVTINKVRSGGIYRLTSDGTFFPMKRYIKSTCEYNHTSNPAGTDCEYTYSDIRKSCIMI